MNTKYFMVLLLVLYRNVNAVEEENTEVYKMSDRVFTCSKWLSSLIDNFCNNVYKVVKRDTSVMLGKLMPKSLIKNRNGNKYFADVRLRRVRRQVASECCERPCTVGIILMYCPDDSKIVRENPDIFD